MTCPTLRLLVLTLPFLSSGCGMLDWADEHMPVIGDRCENWQCFTEGGRQQSEINHQEIVHAQQPSGSSSSPYPPAYPAPTPGGASVPTASSLPAPAVAAPPPPSEPEPAEGAYKYVPRAPSAPGTTPFDGMIPPPVPSE